jgi:hypothetical protein
VELSREQQEILEFERRWPHHTNAKIQAVREFFDWTNGEYERRLAELIDTPEAFDYDPALVREIRRQRRGQKYFLDRSQIVDWR